MVRRAYDKVELFRTRMQERGLKPEDVRSLEDISRLPFTVKTDLRDTYPFGLFASPMQEVVRLHASSGTTGKPIVVAYTQEDVDVWTNAMVRTLAACGLSKGDIVQNAYGYGLFTGGLGLPLRRRGLGATVIPISGGNTDRQIMVMKDFGVTAICCTPSYFVHLIERAGELGVDMRELPLRVGVFGAEPWSESMRRHIESQTRIKAYDIYGLVRDHRPRRGLRVRLPERSAHLRRSFLPGDRQPGDRRAAARGRGRRAGPHHAQQAGHADSALPHPRHHGLHPGPVPLRPHAPAHPPHHPPQRRHVHHPRRERLPVAGGRRRCWRWKALCRTT